MGSSQTIEFNVNITDSKESDGSRAFSEFTGHTRSTSFLWFLIKRHVSPERT